MISSEDLGRASPDTAGGGRLDLRLKRWGLVNAVLCGLLVVATVAAFVLSALRVGDTGVGMFLVIMLGFFIPVAFIPIGLSCLVGAIRSGIALRRHASREARTGLRLSLGGPVAVIAGYAVGIGIFFGIELLEPIVLSEVEPHVDANEVRLTDGSGDLWAPAWSPDGSRLAFTSGHLNDRAIYVMDAGGSNVVQLTDGPAMASHPAWSPDGTRIVFESNRAGRRDYDVYVMDADGSNEVQLTQDGSDPVWSPDGSHIAFASGTYGDRAIYVMDADGNNVVRLTDGATQNNPAWSPDGSRIAFDGYGQDGYPHIYVMDADGSNVLQLTDSPTQGNPAWSPDGSRIAFVGSGQTGGTHIYMMDADGANVVRLTSISDEDGDPAWSPDGSRIAYYCSSKVGSDICVIEVDE